MRGSKVMGREGAEGCLVLLQSIQFYQEEKHFHEIGHDVQDKFVWMTNQDIDN